jgi:hypothetical protein
MDLLNFIIKNFGPLNAMMKRGYRFTVNIPKNRSLPGRPDICRKLQTEHSQTSPHCSHCPLQRSCDTEDTICQSREE